MPARRKSLAVLTLNGSLRKNPGRHAARTDVVACLGGIGEPPEHISVARKHIWQELIGQLPEGHLQSADRWLLEIVTRLMAKLRNRRTLATKGEIALLMQALCKLGVTPVDRLKVHIPPKSKENVYAFGMICED